MKKIKAATVIWFGFFVLAFVNGTLREIVLKQFIQEPWAHHLSALTGILLFTVYLYFVWYKANVKTFKEAILVGCYWLILTVFAETFIVGRLIGKQSWEQILASYNLMQGNLWPLVLAWVAVMPVLFYRIFGK